MWPRMHFLDLQNEVHVSAACMAAIVVARATANAPSTATTPIIVTTVAMLHGSQCLGHIRHSCNSHYSYY